MRNKVDNASRVGLKSDSGPKETAIVTLIHADKLIPGRGEPISNAGLAIRTNLIDWVGSWDELPDKYREITPTHVPVVMPGLWDCHVHFMGMRFADAVAASSIFLPGAPALSGALSAADLKRTLMAGYTSVRELGGFGCDIWPAVRDGHLAGPNIYGSVGALSITGGHGDEHNTPLTTVQDAMNHSSTMVVCDGVEECIKTTRMMVRRGARVIKVCTSGGVLSLNDDPEDRQFSDEELRAIVQEAGRSRRAVAAHAIGKAGILAALRAGFTSIEHGNYLDDEVADMMLEKGATLVATQHIIRTLSSDYVDTLPTPIRKKLVKTAEQSKKAYNKAIKRGVRIALGTDMLDSDPRSRLAHGNNANELRYAVELGMTPLQAIEAATANAPATLGGLAPISGQLKAGYDADIIALSEDPVDDVDALAREGVVTHVWKAGRLWKEDGRAVDPF